MSEARGLYLSHMRNQKDTTILIVAIVVIAVLYFGGKALLEAITHPFGNADKASAGNDAVVNQTAQVITPWDGTKFLQSLPTGTKVTLTTAANAKKVAAKIYDAFGTLHGMVTFDDPFKQVLDALKGFSHKAQIAGISDQFASKYGIGMLQYLDSKRGTFATQQVGSGSEDLFAKILDYVNKLPL